MAKTLDVAECLSDLAVENAELGKEIGRLKKMITLGFEDKIPGADKVAKVLGSEDNEQIIKLYDLIAGLIKSIKLQGSFEQFQNELNIKHSVKIECDSPLRYNTKPKKRQKYVDAYNSYFLETPTTPESDMKKIITSLTANFKEAKVESDKLKDEFSTQLGTIDDTEETLKTLTKLLTRSKLKDLLVADVVSELEVKLSEQEIAISLIQKD